MTNGTKDNTVVIYLIFVQYMKHGMQITQNVRNMIWWQCPWSLRNKRLQHYLKVTVMFVTHA